MNMKMIPWVAGAITLIGSVVAVAQMPPPPPPPPGAGPGMSGPQLEERREIRRIIIRDDEGGPGGVRMFGNPVGVGGMGFFMDSRSVEMMTRGLDLTPQQQGKMTEYVATVRPEMRKLTQEMAAESRRLQELSPGDAKYAATSAEVAKKVGELTGRMIEQNAALRAKVWGLLTPEQRAKADARAKEMRERMRDRMKERLKDRAKDHPHRGDGEERPRMFLLEREDFVG